MKASTYSDIRQSLTTLYRADPLTIFDKELPLARSAYGTALDAIVDIWSKRKRSEMPPDDDRPRTRQDRQADEDATPPQPTRQRTRKVVLGA